MNAAARHNTDTKNECHGNVQKDAYKRNKKQKWMKLNTHMIVTDKDAAAGTEKMMAAGER